MNRFTATILMATLATAGSQFSVAGPPDPPRVTVRYADLDLSRHEGAQALYRRLQGAAQQVCGPFDGRDLNSAALHRACLAQAITEAVVKVDQPLLTAFWQSKTGARSASAVMAADAR